jgi:leader peptidase (prepilin peptidase)/N-methyltransferase
MSAEDWLAPVEIVLVSLCVGSFLGTVIWRLPEGRGMSGRSSCDRCGHPLAPRDLIPLIGWLSCRGRCHYCGAPIARLYPLVELASVGIALCAYATTVGPAFWISCLLGWCLLALAIIDVRHQLLPDELTLPLLFGGLTFGWFLDRAEFVDHLVGAAAGFAVFAVTGWAYHKLRGRDGLGFGDVKLLAAIGAWVTWSGLPSVVLLATTLALMLLLLQRILGKPISRQDRVPLGTFLAGAVWIVWLSRPLLIG